jgi:hypothetical protein
MLISGRAACEQLVAVGVGARAARRLLATGIAGSPVLTGGVHLYEDERVCAVAARPRVKGRDIAEICPAGLFIARRQVDLTSPREEQVQALASGWGEISPWLKLRMGFRISSYGSFPFVATVAGFVVFGAELVAFQSPAEVLLQPPGAWFARLEDHRLLSGPGRPWVVHLGVLPRDHAHVSAG